MTMPFSTDHNIQTKGQDQRFALQELLRNSRWLRSVLQAIFYNVKSPADFAHIMQSLRGFYRINHNGYVSFLLCIFFYVPNGIDALFTKTSHTTRGAVNALTSGHASPKYLSDFTCKL